LAAEIGRRPMLHTPVPIASMRPRPIGRGNRSYRISSPAWPGRFNEAAANWPRKSVDGQFVADSYVDASMRPRPIGRGNLTNSATVAPNAAASMRPRPIGRGNVNVGRPRVHTTIRFNEAAANWPRKFALAVAAAQTVPGASMRPRPIGRGNTSRFWLDDSESLRLQ